MTGIRANLNGFLAYECLLLYKHTRESRIVIMSAVGSVGKSEFRTDAMLCYSKSVMKNIFSNTKAQKGLLYNYVPIEQMH